MKKLSVVLAAVLLLCAATAVFAADRDWSIFRTINPGAFEDEEPTAAQLAFLESLDEEALCAAGPVVEVTDTWASSYELGLEIEEAEKAAMGSYARFYAASSALCDAFDKYMETPMDEAGVWFFYPFSDHSIDMAYTSQFSEDMDESQLAQSYRMVASFFSDGECTFEKPEPNHYIGTMSTGWYDENWERHAAQLTQDCTFDPEEQVMVYNHRVYVPDVNKEIDDYYKVTYLGDDTYEIDTGKEFIHAVYVDGVLGDFTYYMWNDKGDAYKYQIERSGDDLRLIIDGKEV